MVATTVQIENNVIESGQRAAYIEQSGAVSIVDNTFGPMAGTGITVADCTGRRSPGTRSPRSRRVVT